MTSLAQSPADRTCRVTRRHVVGCGGIGGVALAAALVLFCNIGDTAAVTGFACNQIKENNPQCQKDARDNCKSQHITFPLELFQTMSDIKSRVKTARSNGQLGPYASGSSYSSDTSYGYSKNVADDGIDDALVHSFMTGRLASRVHDDTWGRGKHTAKNKALGFMNSREECQDGNPKWMDMNNNRVGGETMVALTKTRCTFRFIWCLTRKEFPPSDEELWNALLSKAKSAQYVTDPKNHRYNGALIHLSKNDNIKHPWTVGAWGGCSSGVKRRSVSCPKAIYLCNAAKPETSTRDGCPQPPPPPPSCISGEMLMREQSRGQIRVADLIPGDVIQGIDGAQANSRWCSVEGVYLANYGLEQTTYDGVTAMHMTVQETQALWDEKTEGTSDDAAPPQAALVVRPQGTVGTEHVGQVYTLVTDCDAVQNDKGQVITPISTLFCPIDSMSWSDYRTLFGAIRRVTRKTGPFWYNVESFHNNETAASKEYHRMLPRLCETLLECAGDGVCQRFEHTITEFVETYVDPELTAASVMPQFPHLGETADGNHTVPGSVSATVRDSDGDDFATPVLAATAAVFVVASFVLILLLVKSRKQMQRLLEQLATGSSSKVSPADAQLGPTPAEVHKCSAAMAAAPAASLYTAM